MSTKSKSHKKKFVQLKYLDPKCAGIDVGADSIFACVLDSSGKPQVKEFPVFTKNLLNMAEWFKERGVESIAMESTGVYWIPIFEILDEHGFDVILVNAFHLKCVPGRKTDIKDSQWIQQLHSNGLLQGSFRPTNEYVRLRALVRQRSELYKEGARKIQHMHKALTEMNIQLRIVLSDITGKTGLSIIQAIIGGEKDPKKLASFRDSRCKKSQPEIVSALEGNWREEHLFTLRQSYEAYEFFHKQINDCEKQIKEVLDALPPKQMNLINQEVATVESELESHPIVKKAKRTPKQKNSYNRSPYHFDAALSIERVCGVNITEIPGIDGNIAMTILSEVGTDMTKWKSKKHFSSWLSLCPGNKISGGKILSSRTRRSDNRAAQALRLAANSVRNTETAIGAYYRRMRSKFGPAKAITATAHKIAVSLYIMLKHKVSYKELGRDHYEIQYKERVLKNLKKKAMELGYKISPIIA